MGSVDSSLLARNRKSILLLLHIFVNEEKNKAETWIVLNPTRSISISDFFGSLLVVPTRILLFTSRRSIALCRFSHIFTIQSSQRYKYIYWNYKWKHALAERKYFCYWWQQSRRHSNNIDAHSTRTKAFGSYCTSTHTPSRSFTDIATRMNTTKAEWKKWK